MKIGIDGRLWNETGVGRYIRNLVGQLADIDKVNEYVLFARSSDVESIKYYVSSIKYKIVVTDIRWHSVGEQLRLPSILEKEKLDLVHFPYFSVPIFYKGHFVVTIHDLIPLHFDTGLATTLPLPFYKAKRFGYKLVLRRAVARASKIIAVSNATKDEVIKYLHADPEKVMVTYEGIDDALNSKIKTQKSKLQFKTQNFFLYVGNAYPHKNLERLLEALNILIRQLADPNISLVLVGKEDYFYRRLEDKVNSMNLTEHVEFKREVSDEELSALYQNAKALVVPSLMEGFGLPTLEAMANKCLVLASDIPALREICQEAAIYFNPFDVNDIEEKMRRVYINDVHHYSENKHLGAQRVKEFSWKKMAEETLNVYEEAVG